MMSDLECVRLLNAEDPLYREGLELLWQDGRIAFNQIDTPEDFYWWMKAWEKERTGSPAGTSDWIFAVTHAQHGTVGFLYSEYYPPGWLYVPYLVAHRVDLPTLYGRVAKSIFDCIQKILRSYAGNLGLIYELGYGDYHRGRDKIFRFHIAQHGLRLRKLRILQPALSLYDGEHDTQEDCLCVVTSPAHSPNVQAVLDFMYDRIYSLQDQGSPAYLAHCRSVKKQMAETLRVNGYGWTEAWHPSVPDSASSAAPALLDLPSASPPPFLIHPKQQHSAFVEVLRDGKVSLPRLALGDLLAEIRCQIREYDIFIDEPLDQIHVRGSLAKLGDPVRAFLWLTLTHIGMALPYETVIDLLCVHGDANTLQSYKSRLASALRPMLTRRIFRAVRGRRAWQVAGEKWSFCWLRRNFDRESSTLIHGLRPGRSPVE